MKTQLRQAIITTSREAYLRYCMLNGLSDDNSKQVKIKNDIEGETFSESICIDGHQNVTDWVKQNIKIFKEY